MRKKSSESDAEGDESLFARERIINCYSSKMIDDALVARKLCGCVSIFMLCVSLMVRVRLIKEAC